jgi:hypothetical protein
MRKVEIVGRQRNETPNAERVLVDKVTGIQLRVVEEDETGNVQVIGNIAVNEHNGSFSINAPIPDVQKMADTIGKILCGELLKK